MKILFKNQVVGIWKRWINFILIFFLLLFSISIFSGSISTSANVKDVFSALEDSAYLPSQITVNKKINFSDQAFETIENYFNNGINFTTQQKTAINSLQKVNILNASHQEEYDKSGNNFLTWLLWKDLKLQNYTFDWSLMEDINYQLANSQKTLLVNLRVGFNDNYSNENLIQHKYDKVEIVSGHAPNSDNEVVVLPGFKNLTIGTKIAVNNEKYQIVGTGFSLYDYVTNRTDNVFLTPSIYFTNHSLHQYWLLNTFNNNNRTLSYYLSLSVDKFKNFADGFSNYYLDSRSITFDKAKVTNYQNKISFVLVQLQITIYFWVSIVMFILTLIVLLVFLKKSLSEEKGTWGILLSLGNRPSLLAIIVSFSYFTILILPIVFGFVLGIFFQWYLTNQIASVIYIFYPIIKIKFLQTFLSLVAIPIIILFTTLVLLKWYLSQPVLSLIKNGWLKKPKKTRNNIAHNHSRLESLALLRWMRLFFFSNFKKMISVNFLFFLVTGFLFLGFNAVGSYQYSREMASKLINLNVSHSLIKPNNTTLNNFFGSISYDWKYSDNDYGQLQVVSVDDFNSRIDKDFFELKDISDNQEYYHKFISSKSLQADLEEASFIAKVKANLPVFYSLIQSSQDLWSSEQKWPIITFGFKIFDSKNDLPFSSFPGQWFVTEGTENQNNDFQFYSFNDSSFINFFYYDNDASNDSISAFDEEDLGFINAILPLQMAKKMNVKINDVITAQVGYNEFLDQEWNKIPLKIVGFNRYSYLSELVIINQKTFVDFLLSKHSNVTINNITNLSNILLGKQDFPVLKNVGFYKDDFNYHNSRNFYLIGSFDDYLANNLNDYLPLNDVPITAFLITLKFLIALISLFSLFVIFLLIFLSFNENKKSIVSLKILGYYNREINFIFSCPYILSFGFILGIDYLICLNLLKWIINLIFTKNNFLLLFSFSYILTTIIVITVVMVLFVFYVLASAYIAKEPFAIVLNANN